MTELEEMRFNSLRGWTNMKTSYEAGALDMQEKMINKACKWLRENMNIHQTSFSLTNPPEPGKFINAEEAFRKAMEEL